MTRAPHARVIYDAHPSSEWHTPAWLRTLAWEVLERIDLDPATDERNQLRAARFFTREQDGRAHRWTDSAGVLGNVWMNPPYGKGITELWTADAALYGLGHPESRMLSLVPARPGARWYRRFTGQAQLFCELDGRVRFELPDGTPAPDQARWGSVLVYYGPDRARAARVLRRHGAVRLVNRSPRLERCDRRALELEMRGQLRLVE